MDSSSTLVKGAPLKRGGTAVLMAAALHASSTDLKSSSTGSLNRQFLFPERKEPLSPVLVPSSGPSGEEQRKQASNNNNSHDSSESDSDASNSSDDSYDSDDDDEDKSAAAATGDGAALSSRTRAPSWESSTTSVATTVEDENASIKTAAAAAAASLNPAASVDVLAEIRKMIKEELGQFRDDKDKKGEEQQKTQGQDTPTQQPPRTRSPPSSQPSPVSKSTYAFPSLQQQQPAAPGPAASSTPSSPGRQTEARWSGIGTSPVVEMSAVDQKWGVLFDGQGVGTKRLEQVLKGFARYIAEELTPRKMEVVTPDKVVIFYLHYKLDVEVFPFTAVFSGRGRQAHERVADLYHQLGCEYYLVPAEAQCRPTMPGLTLRGFAQWMTWTIRAYPDEEARRLARAVTALPFNAESLLDGKPERLPKQISRHLLPEKPDQDARARFDDVLKRAVDDMQLSPSSAASATFRGVPLANLGNSSTAQPFPSPRQEASASSNSSTTTRRASDSRASSPRSRYHPRSEVPSSASSAASWQTDEDYNNHSRRRSATGTGTGGGTTPRARSGSVRDGMSTGAGYARSMSSASHASNSSAARRDPPSSSRAPPAIVTAASSAASSNSTNARRSRRGSSPPPFGHRHHSLSVGDMLPFPSTPSPTAVKFDTSNTAASGRGRDRGRSARDERDRDRDRERERERERERDRRGRRPASLVSMFSSTSASGGVGGSSSSSSSRRSTSRRRPPPVVIVHDDRDRDRDRDRERDRDRDRERDRDGRGPTWQEYLAGPAAGAAPRSGTRVRRPSEARSSTS
ncbi:hypothetical protein B0T24DRAFT_307604 [Lasiosphaeria ovina]|uniref:DUF7514 domain-containing protein n=1 Tax=Lasiosphaeria ovina TaxID=92902 RepID=A0AAE0K6Y7_9PEZI|nr:hypothetical protein B0T24DRAFT_307604 [Lasiosphaeria ovina]